MIKKFFIYTFSLVSLFFFLVMIGVYNNDWVSYYVVKHRWLEVGYVINIFFLIVVGLVTLWKKRHNKYVQLFFPPISSVFLMCVTIWCQDQLRQFVYMQQSGAKMYPVYHFWTFVTTYVSENENFHPVQKVIFLNWDRMISFFIIGILLFFNFKSRKQNQKLLRERDDES